MLTDIYYYWAMLKNAVALDSARLMQADIIVRLNIQALLLVGSAFFSCSETAMFSLFRLDLQRLNRVFAHRRIPRGNKINAVGSTMIKLRFFVSPWPAHCDTELLFPKNQQ